MTVAAIDSTSIDEVVSALREHAASWTAVPLGERIALLERMLPAIAAGAEDMAAAGSHAKGLAADSAWATEDWISGPWALAQNIQAHLHVLRRIEAGQDPVRASAVHERDGRTYVDVLPATRWDTLLLNGFSAQVWLRPGVTPQLARARAAGQYRGRPGHPAVALVLGAGNVAAITALDILHKLYAQDQVVVAKLNPVNAYLRPHFERIFTEFVQRNWVRFTDGGAAEGAYLATHHGVDSIHVTGSERTHSAILWGTGTDGERRRVADQPRVTKPFTSELGGVSPCIVVPGRWRRADFRYQAEHIVTSKMNNSGHNCIASQVLILPRDWDGTPRLLAEIRRVLRALTPRPDYYPGAGERLAAIRAAHPEAESYDNDPGRILVPDITDYGDMMITDEIFASALGVVCLSGTTAAEFLRNATDFANGTLPGTLGATLIVDPGTEKSDRTAVAAATAGLRYGTIGINCWSAFGFLLGYTPWGAYPGHTRQEIGSGTGFVHNAFMLEDVEKTVIRAPFAPAPRSLFTASPALSPKPPYFVTSRTGRTTVERLVRFTAAPSIAKLPGVLASALHG
jgi:acyl-CoA reductase-like NAD-dependent aldehyde dehydrogenase